MIKYTTYNQKTRVIWLNFITLLSDLVDDHPMFDEERQGFLIREILEDAHINHSEVEAELQANYTYVKENKDSKREEILREIIDAYQHMRLGIKGPEKSMEELIRDEPKL